MKLHIAKLFVSMLLCAPKFCWAQTGTLGGGDSRSMQVTAIESYVLSASGLKTDLVNRLEGLRDEVWREKLSVVDPAIRAMAIELLTKKKSQLIGDIKKSPYEVTRQSLMVPDEETPRDARTVNGILKAKVEFNVVKMYEHLEGQGLLGQFRENLIALAFHEHARHFGIDDHHNQLGQLVSNAIIDFNNHPQVPVDRQSTNSVDVNVADFNSDQINGDPEQVAEDMALRAEQLVTSVSFMYAYPLFLKVLKVDPQNFRAQFYANFLYPLMVSKGILGKALPLVKESPINVRFEYESISSNLRPGSSLHDFYFNHDRPFANEQELQQQIKKISEALDRWRKFIGANSDKKIKLNLNVPNGSLGEVAYSCEVTKDAEVFHLRCPLKDKKTTTYEVERADFEMLRQSAAGMQILASLATAYNLNGIGRVLSMFEDSTFSHGRLSDKQSVEIIRQNPNLGKLQDPASLELIKTLASDILGGMKWAHKMKRDVCPQGNTDEQNRPGKLFGRGICLQTSNETPVEQLFSVLDALLNGQTLGPHESQKLGLEIATDVNYLAVIERPIEDIQSLLPTEFDDCGNAANLPNSTLNGLLPKGDGLEVLTAKGVLKKCEK